MPDFSHRKPEDCPSPSYHETHMYCPSCSFVAPSEPKLPTLAEAQVAAILSFCDDAERIYKEAGLAGVPGLSSSAALVSTHGIRTELKRVAAGFR